MPLTVRSEIRRWENASKIEDCTQNYVSVPKVLFSGENDFPAGSLVQGKIIGISFQLLEDLDQEEYSSTIKEKRMRSRLIKGQDDCDYLFLFTKDWNSISKFFDNSKKGHLMYLLENISIGKKKQKVFSGNSVFWEESYGNYLEI